MSTTASLYASLATMLEGAPWRDQRHKQTFAWMVVGLLSSGWVGLSKWAPFVVGRAVYAQSIERRFQRWLSNPRIDVLRIYAGLLRGVLPDLPERLVLVALDTTVLWDGFCVVQLALVYRGRTVPLAWKVMEHPSASVAFLDYRGVLGFAARLLRGYKVVFAKPAGASCTATCCAGS